MRWRSGAFDSRWVRYFATRAAWRTGLSRKTPSRTTASHTAARRSAPSGPGSAAMNAPLSAPMLVPSTRSGRMPCSASARSIPTSLDPSTPPPPRTYAVVSSRGIPVNLGPSPGVVCPGPVTGSLPPWAAPRSSTSIAPCCRAAPGRCCPERCTTSGWSPARCPVSACSTACSTSSARRCRRSSSPARRRCSRRAARAPASTTRRPRRPRRSRPSSTRSRSRSSSSTTRPAGRSCWRRRRRTT